VRNHKVSNNSRRLVGLNIQNIKFFRKDYRLGPLLTLETECDPRRHLSLHFVNKQ